MRYVQIQLDTLTGSRYNRATIWDLVNPKSAFSSFKAGN